MASMAHWGRGWPRWILGEGEGLGGEDKLTRQAPPQPLNCLQLPQLPQPPQPTPASHTGHKVVELGKRLPQALGHAAAASETNGAASETTSDRPR